MATKTWVADFYPYAFFEIDEKLEETEARQYVKEHWDELVKIAFEQLQVDKTFHTEPIY